MIEIFVKILEMLCDRLEVCVSVDNKVEIRKIKATKPADRDFLVIYSGHG